eukprot:CAMPEP_0194566728 /NCGR_PEP_ID=MMETSP0292-20121207/5488_1 /TAXON_ID=39354 /ORGANISM="Heterosigma akashiwo, Strain CCMP2393" /LENGTH=121 /DNA_ID=CAMNT_0039416357 /DNA_START=57 /DNA_END=419 /DNA_ORIENTATION=+
MSRPCSVLGILLFLTWRSTTSSSAESGGLDSFRQRLQLERDQFFDDIEELATSMKSSLKTEAPRNVSLNSEIKDFEASVALGKPESTVYSVAEPGDGAVELLAGMAAEGSVATGAAVATGE